MQNFLKVSRPSLLSTTFSYNTKLSYKLFPLRISSNTFCFNSNNNNNNHHHNNKLQQRLFHSSSLWKQQKTVPFIPQTKAAKFVINAFPLPEKPRSRKSKTTTPPLSTATLKEEHPQTPPTTPTSNLSTPNTKIAQLPNGIRVATEDNFGQAAVIGVFVNAGSRNETFETNGLTHILQRMGFKATKNTTSGQIVQQLESLGVNAMSSSSREAMVYTSEIVRSEVKTLIEIMADVVQNALFLPEDVIEQQNAIILELENMASDPVTWLPEVLHEVAYGSEALGLPQVCPSARVSSITPKSLQDFVDTYYRGPNVVVTGVGVEHDYLVDMVGRHFGALSAEKSPHEHRPPSRYVGGMHYEPMLPEDEKRLKEILPQTGKEPPSHIAVAFESPSLMDNDLYASCVLQTLLGGGSSFSSGGPGKGMYSRLYRRVLNGYGWVDSASAFNSFYSDSGLFGIYGTAPHSELAHMLEIICVELAEVAITIDEEELQRAKNQLRSALFMNLESRNILLDDIGRQVLAYGHRKPALEICDAIQNVTAEQLSNLAAKILTNSKPSVIAYTPEKYIPLLPSYENIETWFKGLPSQIAKIKEEQK